MVTHADTREMPIYNLVFARDDRRFGPSFKETPADCRAESRCRLRRSVHTAAERRASMPGRPGFSAVTPAGIAGSLTPFAGRPVIDKTGLAGTPPPPADPDGAIGSDSRRERRVDRLAQRHVTRIAGERQAHPAGDVPVTDPGVRIGKAECAAGTR